MQVWNIGWKKGDEGMRTRLVIGSLLLVVTLLLGGSVLAQGDAGSGLVSTRSAYSVDETTNQLRTALEDQGLIVVTTVDHAANAQNVGEDLRPTQLLIFGNPNLGTPLMQSSQTTAIDLPQKFLIWEDADGQVSVTYNDPQYLVDRHGITGQDEVLNRVATALNNFATSVAPEAGATAPEATAAPDATAPAPTSAPAGAAPTTAPADAAPAPDAPTTLPETGKNALPLGWVVLAAGVLLAVGGVILWRVRGSALFLLLVVPLLTTLLVAPPVTAQTDAANGLVSVASPYSVEETVSRLQTALDENGLITVATINHAANAEGVGLDLRPTQLIIFGNPNIGTQLMQSNQTIGIDLPQKFLVWEDADGQVSITYNDPQYLAERHGITDRDEVIGRVATALENLTNAATAE
jgi:uncharacterized protein (DUF302 family)